VSTTNVQGANDLELLIEASHGERTGPH
jgi:hypothetical protein